MDLGISEQQEMLLFKACKEHNGILPVSLARSMYSSKSAAHSAIDKLELAGYIERHAPGYWKVVKVTNDIKSELKQRENIEEESKSDKEKKVKSNSGYEIVQG